MSFLDQLAKLEKAKAELANSEAKLVADRCAALAKLPGDYGYSNLNDFIKALKDAADKAGKGKGKGAKAPKAAKAAKGKRAKITPEVKASVKAMVEAGKTGQEIAEELGISQPSVQNIKKELGLVKARVASESAPVAEVAPVQG